MKNVCSYLKLETLWVLLFLAFFISVPLNLLPEGSFAAIALFAVVLFFVNKVSIKGFSLFLFLMAFVLRFCVVIAVPTPPESDFQVLFEASQQMISGNNDYINSSYFQTWSYQLGFVFFQSIFLRIWNNVMILKILNCILGAATCVLVYKIADEFTQNKAAQCMSIIYCFLPFTVFYSTILSNQFVSSFLIYLGIYIVISKKIQWNIHIKYLIFGALLAFANVLRPESIIPLFATILFLLITLKKENIKQNLINLGIVAVVYFGVFNVINYLFIVTDTAPLGLTNNDPLWKFVAGLNHSSHGKYSNDDLYQLQTMSEIELIKSRLFVPISQLRDLFINKIKVFWCGSGVEWAFVAFYEKGLPFFGTHLRITDDVIFANMMSRWIMIISYLLLILGIIKCFRTRIANPNILLIINQIFVTFGVYLLIEVQPRYLYHIQISILIVAAMGIGIIIDITKKLIGKHNSEQKERI